MKLFFKSKDGGPDSSVTGYWLIESKRFFSIVLLKFDGRSREAYHTHAFNAWSWVLTGDSLFEQTLEDQRHRYMEVSRRYTPSLKPIYTPRKRLHKVSSMGTTWVLSFRGPWSKTWKEINQHGEQTFSHGRKVVS